MKRVPGLIALSVLVGDEPPTRVRLFRAGWNDTSKGRFLFDAEAASLVMADYQSHGADVMFDLEHLSLESAQESRNFDPDARAWARLEVVDTADGPELWAADVRWTPDGAERLRSKRQRYVSPAFNVDPETKRITSLLNVAITSLPATHQLTPLVAASAGVPAEDTMTPEQLAQIAEVLGLGADANVEDVLAAIGAVMDKVKGMVEVPEPEETPAEMAADPAEQEKKDEAMAARAALLRDTGAPTVLQALSQVAEWRASHGKLEAERVKLAKERAALEATERRSLVVEMVKLGTETPATAWADDDAKKPAEPWASMKIESLRDRVAKLRSARGPAGGPPVAPSAPGVDDLTDREIAMCSQMKIDPKEYAANKAHVAARRAGKA